MLPPIPYRPFAVRMVLRSFGVWIVFRVTVSYVANRGEFAGVLAGVGSVGYLETVRRHEAVFLGNCGVPRTSLALLTVGTALFLEIALYAGHVVWTTF